MPPIISDLTVQIYEIGFVLQVALLTYLVALPARGRIKTRLVWAWLVYIGYSLGMLFVMRGWNPQHPDVHLGLSSWAWSVTTACLAVLFVYGCMHFWYALIDRKIDRWVHLCGVSTLVFLLGWPTVSDWFYSPAKVGQLMLVFFFPWNIFGLVLVWKSLKHTQDLIETRRLKMVFLAFLIPIALAFVNIAWTVLQLPEANFGALNAPIGVIRSALLVYAIQRYGFIRLDVDSAVEDIFETMDEPVLLLSPDGLITRTNPAGQQQFRLAEGANALSEKSQITDLIPGFAVEMDHFEARLETVSGPRDYSCTCSDVVREEQCVGRVLLLHDVTRDREIAEMKTNFTATVSHEIRTPLTAILGFSRMIQKRFQSVILQEFEPQDKKETRAVNQIEKNLEVILSEGRRLTKLVDEVLDIAKIEKGTVDWTIRTHDLGTIIEHALASAHGLFAHKPVVTLIEEHRSPMPALDVDGDRIIQVLLNLLSNAVKFTPEGTVTLRTEQLDQAFRVEVIDTGAGIAEADQPRVFDKFQQVGDSGATKTKGTGLGLPISKEIIEFHGGEIGVQSVPGEGSTFFFTLPLVRSGKHHG
jgi:signal transduction histidine kinase